MSESKERRVVVWDPARQLDDGTIIDEKEAHPLRSKGVAMLPIVPGLTALSGAGGWVKRSFGYGDSLSSTLPGYAARIVLYCDSAFAGLHWVARLVVDKSSRQAESLLAGTGTTGTLRLVSDPSQRNRYTCAVNAFSMAPDLTKLGRPDEWRGWTIEGRGKM